MRALPLSIDAAAKAQYSRVVEWKEEHRSRQNSRKGSWEGYRRRGGVFYIATMIVGIVMAILGLLSFLLFLIELCDPDLISPDDIFPWSYLKSLLWN